MNGNYDESASVPLQQQQQGGGGSMVLSCANCGDDVTALAVFAHLPFVSSSSSSSFSAAAEAAAVNITVSCTNCTGLVTLGVFPVLQALAVGGPGSKGAVFLSCTNCPVLETMGSFGALEQLLDTAPAAPAAPTAAVTGASTTTESATESASQTASPTPSANPSSLFSNNNSSSSGQLSVACSNCPSVSLLGWLPLLTQLDSNDAANDNGVDGAGSVSLALSCVDCGSPLTSLGVFPSMTVVASSGAMAQLNVACVRCAGLLTLGQFAVLGDVVVVGSSSENATVTAAASSSSSSLELTCDTCGSLTTMGVFPQLQHISNMSSIVGSGGTVSFSMVCTACDALSSLGLFPSLVAVSVQQQQQQQTTTTTTTTSTSVMTHLCLVCDGCVSLTQLGTFAALQSLASDAAATASASNVTLACVNCTGLGQLAVFPSLVSVSSSSSSTSAGSAATSSQLVVSCSSCASLSVFGVFGQLRSIDDGDGGQVQLTCTDCDGPLASFGLFPALLALSGQGGNGNSNNGINGLQLACLGCANVLTLGQFDALGSLTDVNASCAAVLSLTCVDCANVTTLGSFRSLATLAAFSVDDPSSSTATVVQGQLTINCTRCASLDTLTSMPELVSLASVLVTGSGDDGGSSDGSSSSASASTSASANKRNGVDDLFEVVVVVAPSVLLLQGTLQLSCTSCEQLSSFVRLPSFTSGSVLVSPPSNGTADAAAPGPAPALDQAPSVSLSLNMTCTDCPSFVAVDWSLLPALAPALEEADDAALSAVLQAIHVACNQCGPTFNASLPVQFSFVAVLPVLLDVVDGAGLSLVNISSIGTSGNSSSNGTAPATTTAASVDPLGSLVGVSRLSSLTIDSCSVLTQLDSLRTIERIDGQLTVSNCANLSNMDGLTMQLTTVGAVTIINNPVLCNVDYNVFIVHSEANPVLGHNGGAMCVPLVPVPPTHLVVLALTDTSVQLTWQLPSQPSVTTVFELVQRTVGAGQEDEDQQPYSSSSSSTVNSNSNSVTSIASFTPFAPLSLPVTIGPLSALTQYSYVVTATLDGVVVSSQTLFVTTAAPPNSACPLGYTGAVPNCTLCPAGSYVAPDQSHCALCPSGSYSLPGSVDSSACSLCPYGSFASAPGGWSTCSSCPQLMCCPYGSAGPLDYVPRPVPVTVMTVVAVAGEAVDGSDSDSDGDNGSIGTSAAATAATVIAEPLDPGLILLILCVSIGTALTVLALLARRQVHRFVSRFSMVMRTPRWLLRADAARGGLIVEKASFVRGIVGFWIVLVMTFVTVYQIVWFARNQYQTVQSLQPGTVFAGQGLGLGLGLVTTTTASATTQLRARVVLTASPVVCVKGNISNTGSYMISASFGSLVLARPSCTTSGLDTTIEFSTGTNALVPTAPDSSAFFSLSITSAHDEQGIVFTPVLAYTLELLQYDGTTLLLNETLVPSSGGSASTSDNLVFSGTTVVSIAGVPAQQQRQQQQLATSGYSFSYIQTTASQTSMPAQSLVVSFEIRVPAYYLRVQTVEAISVLVFCACILSIGIGVIAVGTLIGFLYAYVNRNYIHDDAFELQEDTQQQLQIEQLGDKYF